MIIVTSEHVAGHKIVKSLGTVYGVTVRSRGVGGNLKASFRTVFGGEVKEYAALVEETRQHALDRLSVNAAQMGANAVIMTRFDSCEMMQSMQEVVAFGTAVVIEPDPAA